MRRTDADFRLRRYLAKKCASGLVKAPQGMYKRAKFPISRHATFALKAATYVEDKNSGELRRPHHIDLKTGMYRGRQVLTPKESA